MRHSELSVDVIDVIDAAATKPYGFMPFYPGGGGRALHSVRSALPAVAAARASLRFAADAHGDDGDRVAAPRGRDHRRGECWERPTKVPSARVLVVGVTYKPGVADIRESPALEIIDELVGPGARSRSPTR